MTAMNVHDVNTARMAMPSPQAGSPVDASVAGQTFDELLNTERGRLARQAAEQFVADAFVVPALQTLRDGPFAVEDGPFATTTTERRFGPMFDSILADRIVGRTKWSLIDTVARRLLNQGRSTASAQTGVRIA